MISPIGPSQVGGNKIVRVFRGRRSEQEWGTEQETTGHVDGTRAPLTPKQQKWMHRREEKRKRIQHLLDTSVYDVVEERPILPTGEKSK